LSPRSVLEERYLDFEYKPIHGQPGSTIHRQWLAEAEILLLEDRYMGRLMKSIKLESFVMNPAR
jgi:hypothetical protein